MERIPNVERPYCADFDECSDPRNSVTIKVSVENIPSVPTVLDPSAALVILYLKSLLVAKADLI